MLKEVLVQVSKNSGEEFSGVGLIVYQDYGKLPVHPLRVRAPEFRGLSLIESLVRVSSLKSEYHDGFHLISSDWNLTHFSQYFSPPIVSNVKINYDRIVGGRYVAALYGSMIEGVKMCGIASKGFGVAIFERGVEVYFKAITND